jgi:hypothetical protein
LKALGAMAYSISQTKSAARLGSTSSANVLGIFLAPISNMIHLLKPGLDFLFGAVL